MQKSQQQQQYQKEQQLIYINIFNSLCQLKRKRKSNINIIKNKSKMNELQEAKDWKYLSFIYFQHLKQESSGATNVFYLTFFVFLHFTKFILLHVRSIVQSKYLLLHIHTMESYNKALAMAEPLPQRAGEMSRSRHLVQIDRK